MISTDKTITTATTKVTMLRVGAIITIVPTLLLSVGVGAIYIYKVAYYQMIGDNILTFYI